MSSVIDLCDDSDQDQVDAFEATNHQDDSSSSSSSSSSDDEIWTASAFSQSSTASKKAPRDVSCRKPQGRRGKGLADDGNKSQNGKTRTKHSSPIEEGLNESEDDTVSYDNLQQRSLLKKTTNFLSSGTTSKDSTNSSKDDIRASPHASTQKSNTKRAIVPPSKNSGTTNTGKRQKTTGPENDEVECIEIESCSDDDLGDDFNNFNNGKKNIEKSPEKSNGPSSLLTKDATHNPYTKKNENLRRRNDWMAREEYKKSQKTKGKSTASGKTLPVITNLSSMPSVKLNSRLNGQQFLSKSSTSDDSESDDSLYVSAESSNGRKSKATTTTQPGQIRYLPKATEKCTHQSGYESEISHSSHSSQATVPLPPNLQRENGFGNRNNPSSKPDEFNENDRSEFILELSDEDIDEADNTFADEEFRIKKPMHYNLEKKEGSDYNPIQQYTTKSMSKNDSLLDIDSSDSDGIFDHLAINKESTTASIRSNETKGNRVRNPYDKTKSTAPSPSVPRKDRVDRALGSTITLSISQLKSELENIYGICTKGYLEKRELAMALAEARVDAISSATGTDPEEATNPDDSINVSFGVERSFFDCAGDKLVDYDNVEVDDDTEIPNLSKPTKTPSRDKSPNSNRIDLLESDSDVSSPLFTPQPAKMAIQQKKPSNTEKAPAYQSTKKCPGFLSSSSSKLLTPCAFSPPINSPMATFAAKRKVPTPSIPALSNDLIKEIGGKLYPDLRHNFILALTCHARKFRHNSYQRGSFDAALRSVVVISMHLSPIRSPEAARRLKGVASHFYEILKESVAGSKGKKPYHPIKDKFSCVASAALVALLEMEESSEPMTLTNGNSFPMEDLIQNINRLIDTRSNASLNQTAQQYMDPDNLDPGWGQVKKLCATNANTDLCGPFMKERKKKGACPSGVVFELLEAGREMAKKLRDLAKKGPAEPGPLRQLPNDTVDEEFGNVTMSMDHREGGGSSKGLHTMCDQLDIRGVPYVVRELKIADYVFFIGDKLAPVLIERKSAEDVAGSLHDGRWERQQRNMRKAQYVLGDGHARRCQICYIIEGDPNKRKVHGGNVGRRTWFQSVDDCESAISELPLLGFSVMRSKGHLDTIGILAKVAQDVSWKVKNGIIDVKYTYKQFLDRIKVCDEKLGNPPTLKEHQNPAPPVVVNWNPAGLKSTNTKKTSDDPKKTDKSNNPEPAPEPNMNYSEANSSGDGENCEEISELKKMSLQALKDLCKERGDKIGGKKEDLIARLLKPRKPEILIMRARRNEYVPKIPSCNAALMVALHLHHIPGTQGLAKERLMVLAEETGVSKDSMSGDGGFYDGWSGMKDLLRGDPALVKREKGQKFSLTTQPPESSGVAVANALHILAHREGLCTCGNTLE